MIPAQEPSGTDIIMAQSPIPIFSHGNMFMEVILKHFQARFKIKLGLPNERMNKFVWPCMAIYMATSG